MTQAAAEARSQIANGARDPHLHNIIAWHLAMQGDLSGSFSEFQKALAISPRDPETFTNMAAIYREQGMLRDAVLHADAAIAAAPTFVDAWLERAYIMASGGSMDQARFCYEQVVALDGRHAPGLAGLASMDVRVGNFEDAQELAERALAVDPVNIMATCALASCEIERREFTPARDRLAKLSETLAVPTSERAQVFNLLGDACDKGGDPDSAFHNYVRSKSDFEAVNAARLGQNHSSHRDFVARIEEELRATIADDWRKPVSAQPENAAKNHIFLMGYPRSGTTLVENILASAPNVAALEERQTFGAADTEFLQQEAGLARLSKLEPDCVAPFQQAYWDKVAASGADAAGKTFVDMDPLKATRLPLIAKLFPEARILIMRRDPRDVVWSCFHTDFALSSAARDFVSLEKTARHYDAMMRLTMTALEILPLHTHIVSYDKVVRDFDNETKALCTFSNIPWSEDLRQFDKTAAQRGVSTASASQVRKPLYDGTRQWQRYAKYLEPVLPILTPWIKRFGFEA